MAIALKQFILVRANLLNDLIPHGFQVSASRVILRALGEWVDHDLERR